jgi:AraC-like DNA-binding protein
MRQQPDIRINELSMDVGFNTPKYFTKCFKKEFGFLPSEFLEMKSDE